jgi:hypothetical protein
MLVGGTLFCGNGVNINGSYTDQGGNELNGQCPPACPGDANGDTRVDGGDIAVTLARWGACVDEECYSDFNGDGTVDGADLGILLTAYGGCFDAP